MSTQVIPGPYTTTPSPTLASNSSYTRVVTVSGSMNNPLTLTGSYANNAAFILKSPNSVTLRSVSGDSIDASILTAGVVYKIALSYTETTDGAQVQLLYK